MRVRVSPRPFQLRASFILLPTTLPAALLPQHWPFALDWLPPSAYLVGGCVRDALQGRLSAYLDLDFVLPDHPVETAQAIARQYQAGFVRLDAERQIARVVFPQATADFALQVGPDLTTDLQRRDFTVNAIAYHPHTQTLIDPLNGQRDLQGRVMRMISAQNLLDDPLRLLRAYRQASQLGFTLEPQTQATIRQLAPRLSQIAPERVRVELGYLLSHPAGTPWLQTLATDGLLSLWFPDATPAHVDRVGLVDQVVARLAPIWANALDCPLNPNAQGSEASQRTLRTAVKLVALLNPDPDIAKQTLNALKYARTEITVVSLVLQAWQRWFAAHQGHSLTRADQYYLFRHLGPHLPALVVWLQVLGVPEAVVQSLMQAYLDPDSPIAHPQPLITGKALMAVLHLKPGPQLGQLLAQLDQAQAQGQIDSPETAIALAQTLISAPATGFAQLNKIKT